MSLKVLPYLLLFGTVCVYASPIDDEVKRIFAAPETDAELDTLVSGRIRWLKEAAAREPDLETELGPWSQKVVFSGCEGFPGGLEKLKTDFDRGIQKGLRFLLTLDAHRVADARAYLTILNHPGHTVHVLCHESASLMLPYFKEVPATVDSGQVIRWKLESAPSLQDVATIAKAASTSLGYPHWPAILLSTTIHEQRIRDGLPTDPGATLFHEGMHWLGYRHKGFRSMENDLIEDVTYCAFDSDAGSCSRARTGKQDPSPFLRKDPG